MRPVQVLAQEKSGYAKVEPPCAYFGTCGGCAVQDLAYADQLTLKRERVWRAFAAFPKAPAIDIVGLEEPWRYRNKAELTFGEVHGQLVLGYHAAGSFWQVVDLEDCLLLPAGVMSVVREVLALAAATGWPAYHPRTHQGFFRYLLVRTSRATGRILVCLMTTRSQHPEDTGPLGARAVIERIAAQVMDRHPEVVSFSWGVTQRLADIAVPEELVLLRGAPHLEDRIGPWTLHLAPLSFLQPSSVQADRMYTYLCQALHPELSGVAWDLYCGVGLIGFYLSHHFTTVYGIDVEPQQVELAALNAALNGVHNIRFHAGRVEALLRDRRFWLQEAKPDLIVVDPPRSGLHPQALTSILAARPPHLAYCSCNVQSLVRDLTILVSSFPRYRIAAVRAFDMFPQTNHVEVLALLTRL